jgi:hypothetical protein
MQRGTSLTGGAAAWVAVTTIVLATAIADSARANDSTAHLAAGGLVLSRNDAIEMRSEDLFVSMDEVRVRYRFYNRTDNDVTTLVAFPLPDITAPSDENNFSVPAPDADTNFLEFHTLVDGRPVTMQVEQRAFVLGVDRTDLLKRLGLPIAPHDAAAGKLIVKLPAAAQQELRELGMVKYDEYGAGGAMERVAVPLWSARTTYYWKQTFPAHREIVIAHSYKPSVGGSAQTSVGMEYESEQTRQEYRDLYCVDPPFLRAVRSMHSRYPSEGGGNIISEYRLGYILKTGANWSGAIRNFHLTVDKGAPGNLVSFCMDGVRKVSPTRFEVTKTDFWPTRDLNVLILTPPRGR